MSNDPSDNESTDSSSDAQIEVNLHEKDPSKAITRTEAEPQDEPIRARTTKPKDTEFTKDIAKRFGRLNRQFDQKLAERDAEHQRELRDLNSKFDQLLASKQVKTNDADELSHERAIATLENQLADALEKGESREVAKLQSAISAEHARYASAQTAKMMGEAYERDQAARRSTEQPTKGNNTPAPLGKRFINANADWWHDEDFRAERREAVAIDADLLEEGFDPNTPAHYEELQARLTDKFPNLEVELPTNGRRQQLTEDDDLEDRPRGRQVQHSRAPMSAGANRGAPSQRRNGAVRLNASDIANMQRFGMDPNNDKHVASYAAEKVG